MIRTVFFSIQKAILPILLILTAVVISVGFYLRSQMIMQQQLRERLRSTAAVAALAVDPALVEKVVNEEPAETDAYWGLARTLHDIRDTQPGVRFVYMMKRTDDPNALAFVADADAMHTDEELDVNRNGVVDEDELAALPGELYEISDIPVLRDEAFRHPVVDDTFTVDQWGTFLSAYAPVFSPHGNVIAVIGLDMIADEYIALSRSVVSPVALLLVILIGAVLSLFGQYTLNRRKMEAWQQMDAERTALLDLATHQLGVPLATFRWWVEILKDNKHEVESNEEAIGELEEGIRRMDDIMQSLTDVTQLKEAKIEYKPVEVSFSRVAKEVQEKLSPSLARRKQTLSMGLHCEVPMKLDPKLLTGVLQELIQNASFYSPEGSTIHVAANCDQKMLEFSVTDNGYGIPHKDLPYIFEKFRRGSNATQYRPVGNGLGLYIVKMIIEKAHGKIRITSSEQKGTTVTVRLPIA